jgi:uncharacterized membrane protein YedE/YeeE
MLDFTTVTDLFGDVGAAVVIGALVGVMFGIAAQRSRFCLRAAVQEVGRKDYRGQLGVWLAGFGAAIIATQYLVAGDLVETIAVRPLNEAVSLSGAIVGGLVFGIGMMLANGCASRHLVLAGSGNLRAWAVFALFAVTAWATISGPLAPLREAVAGAWRTSAEHANGLGLVGHGASTGMAIGLVLLGPGVWLAWRGQRSVTRIGSALAVGLVIAAGWYLTTALSRHSFDPTPVESAAFTAPAAHFVAMFSGAGDVPFGFDTGFVPAVLLGALLAAAVSNEFRLQWFPSVMSAIRYGAGAAMMGFGGVLAIGCSVGGAANAALMISASLLALGAMWVGGLVAERVLRSDWRAALGAYEGATSPAAQPSARSLPF